MKIRLTVMKKLEESIGENRFEKNAVGNSRLEEIKKECTCISDSAQKVGRKTLFLRNLSLRGLEDALFLMLHTLQVPTRLP